MVEDVILEALQLLVEQKPRTYGGNGAWESASPHIGEEYKVLGIFSLTGKEMTAFTYHLACSDYRNSDHGGFLRDYIRNHTPLLRCPTRDCRAATCRECGSLSINQGPGFRLAGSHTASAAWRHGGFERLRDGTTG